MDAPSAFYLFKGRTTWAGLRSYFVLQKHLMKSAHVLSQQSHRGAYCCCYDIVLLLYCSSPVIGLLLYSWVERWQLPPCYDTQSTLAFPAASQWMQTHGASEKAALASRCQVLARSSVQQPFFTFQYTEFPCLSCSIPFFFVDFQAFLPSRSHYFPLFFLPIPVLTLPFPLCNVTWCHDIWCDVNRCVLWYEVIWFDIMWCDVVRCHVLSCDVNSCDIPFNAKFFRMHATPVDERLFKVPMTVCWICCTSGLQP